MLSDLYLKSIKLKEEPLAERKNNKNVGDCENSYIFSLPVIRNLHTLHFNKKVTFFAGENGTGKSTLLEALAVNCGFNAEGGSKNFNFASKETHSPLYRYIDVAKGVRTPKDGFFLRAESFYNVATEVERLDTTSDKPGFLDGYGGKSLHTQSHGESFMSLILNRFRGNGLYILDEPEAALSPTRQFTLLAGINELVKQDSQFIIATHSPILLAFPDADIYVLHEDGIKLTPYRETDHYILTKQFLNNTEGMLKYLLE